MALDKGIEKILIASDRQELVDRLLDPEEEIKGIILIYARENGSWNGLIRNLYPHEVIGLVELFSSAYISDIEEQDKEDV